MNGALTKIEVPFFYFLFNSKSVLFFCTIDNSPIEDTLSKEN